MQQRLKADSNAIQEPLNATTWTRDKYIKVLRVMLSDFKELNTLLLEQEVSDEKLGLMLDLALNDFNSDTPATNFTFENFPNAKCLLEGAIVETLMSLSQMHVRNALTYNDNGLVVEDFGKDPRLLNLLQVHMPMYQQLKDSLKRAINVSRLYGNVGSEYMWINNRVIR